MSTAVKSSSPELRSPPEPAANHVNSPPNGNGQRHRQRILIGIGVVAALALGVLAYWFFFMRGIVYTDDARFAGHLVDIAPEINGRVLEVGRARGNVHPPRAPWSSGWTRPSPRRR